MSAAEEPGTNEEYIARVLRQSREQEAEHVQSHSEILQDHDRLKEDYTQKLEITLGVIIILTVAFFAFKIFAADL
jgi:rubrerythrin